MTDYGAMSTDELMAERERLLTQREQPPQGDDIYSDQELIDAYKRLKAQQQPPRAPAPPDWVSDVIKSVPTGLQQGVAAIAGTPQDIGDMSRAGGRWMAEQIGVPEDMIAGADRLASMVPSPLNPGGSLAAKLTGTDQSSRGYNEFFQNTFGKQHEPETVPGEYARTVAEFAPGALAPGGLMTRLSRAVVPGALSETGGQMFKGTEMEGPARFIGGLGGGIGNEFTLAKAASKADQSIGNFLASGPFGVKPTAGQTNSIGAGMERIGPQPPPPEPPPPPIDRRLARRGKMTPEKFDETMAPYEAQGVEPFEFQAYGRRAGVAKMEGLARDSNLEVGEMAQEAIDPAMDNLQTRALNAVARMVSGDGDATNAAKAIDDLKASIREKAKEYDPILTDEAITPELEARLEPILDRIDDGDLAKITKEAQKLAKALGYDKLNDARTLQLTKQKLWNFAEDLGENPLTKERGAIYKQIFHDLQQALHEGIPGYREIDQAYSNLAQRAQLADTLYNRIAGKTEGFTPASIGRNPLAMEDLRGAYGDAAEGFINSQRLIAKDARDFGRANPSVGSPTAAAGSEMLSSALETVAGGPVRWASKITDAIADKAMGARRNALGEQLLKKMTPERRAQFRKALEEMQRDERREALARALAAGSTPKQNPQQEAQ